MIPNLKTHLMLVFVFCLLTSSPSQSATCNLDTQGGALPQSGDVETLSSIVVGSQSSAACLGNACDFDGDGKSPTVGDIAKLLTISTTGVDASNVCGNVNGPDIALQGTIGGLGRTASAPQDYQLLAVADGGITASTTLQANGTFNLTLKAGKRWVVKMIRTNAPTAFVSVLRFPSALGSTSVLPLDGTLSGSLASQNNYELGQISTNNGVMTATNNPLSAITTPSGETFAESTDSTIASSLAGSEAVLEVKAQETVAGTVADSATDLLGQARTLLFRDRVGQTPVEQAISKLDLALAKDPNLSEARVFRGLCEVVLNADAIKDSLNLEGFQVLPRQASGALQAGFSTFSATASPLFDTSIGGLINTATPRAASTTDLNDLSGSALQRELDLRLLPGLNRAIQHLQVALDGTSNSPNWAILIPKDFDNLDLGNYSISRDDVLILTSLLRIAQGFALYASSWQIEGPNNQSPEQAIESFVKTDTNQDGFFTPDEYLPPAPFLTVKSGRSQNLLSAKESFVRGFSDLEPALLRAYEGWLNGGFHGLSAGPNDPFRQNSTLVKQLLGLAGDFLQGPVNLPAYNVCFPNGHNQDPITITKPQINNLTSAQCIVNSSERPFAVNLPQLFSISDLRATLPTLTAPTEDIAVDDQGKLKGPDTTFGGVFPQGIQKSWFDISRKLTHVLPTQMAFDYLYFQLPTGGYKFSFTTSQVDAATRTVNGTLLELTSLTGFDNCGDYYFNCKKSQFITVNTVFPNTMVLDMAGYQPVSIPIDEFGRSLKKYVTLVAE